MTPAADAAVATLATDFFMVPSVEMTHNLTCVWSDKLARHLRERPTDTERKVVRERSAQRLERDARPGGWWCKCAVSVVLLLQRSSAKPGERGRRALLRLGIVLLAARQRQGLVQLEPRFVLL